MVTVIENKNPWEKTFRNFGEGVAEGYTENHDRQALQNAIAKLPADATPRQVIDALTGARTYSNQATQQAITNYATAAGLEKSTRKEKADEEKFAEEKRATNELESHRKRSLDIQENKQDKTKKDINKVGALKSGLLTIKEMKDIGKKGNLGIGTGIRKVFSDEAAKDAGQYEQLGKSLIQLSTNIPIRNRQEFETLAHGLYDPSIRDAEREGILTGLENIINRSVLEDETEIQKETGTEQENVPGSIEKKLNLPNAASFNGKTITSPEGQKYYSDGTKWVKK